METRPDGDPRNIGTLLLTPHELLANAIIAEISRRGFVGVGMAQSRVFENLVVEGPGSLSEVARRLAITKQALALTVTRMVELGYLEVAAHPTDARAHVVSISSLGWYVVAVANEVITATEERWANAIGQRRWAALRRTLIDLNALD
jgi:DNA-binding MarR family transcriptional regulator